MITGAAIAFLLWAVIIIISMGVEGPNFDPDYPKIFLFLILFVGTGFSVGYLFS